jgi:hypothetical protein
VSRKKRKRLTSLQAQASPRERNKRTEAKHEQTLELQKQKTLKVTEEEKNSLLFRHRRALETTRRAELYETVVVVVVGTVDLTVVSAGAGAVIGAVGWYYHLQSSLRVC